MYFINGNYGNPTLALLQWVYEQTLSEVTVMSVDTGWAAARWHLWTQTVQDYARRCGFAVSVVKPRLDFANMVRERQGFPSQKFQWCASMVKGLPLLDYLDKLDPHCEATILMGKRQSDLPASMKLEEIIAESEHFGGRKVWHPLRQLNDNDFYALIKRAGFTPLAHRSLECDACIHNNGDDFQRLEKADIVKIAALEQELGRTMFAKSIEQMLQIQHGTDETEKNFQQQFYKSCGSPFGCGE